MKILHVDEEHNKNIQLKFEFDKNYGWLGTYILYLLFNSS